MGNATQRALNEARALGYVLQKDGTWKLTKGIPYQSKEINTTLAVQNIVDSQSWNTKKLPKTWQPSEHVIQTFVKAAKTLPEVLYPQMAENMREYEENQKLTNQIANKVNSLAKKGVDKASSKIKEIYQSTDPIVKENILRYISNNTKDPYRANIDAGLYILDKAGIPSNITNYLRDLNVSIPYRAKAGLETLAKTLITGKGDYNETLKNPSLFTTLTLIEPLINTNSNFTKEQLDLIKKAAGDKGYITSSDIKRISSDGRYGKNGSISDYFSSDKIIQSALGQTTKDSKTGEMLDYYDFNTKSNVAKSDNNNYLQAFLENPNINYAALRAIAPYINTVDAVPDLYKILTRIK